MTYDVEDANGNDADQVIRTITVVTGDTPVIVRTGTGVTQEV